MGEKLSQELQKAVEAKNPYQIIDAAKRTFLTIAEKEGTGILFEKESMFAYQSLIKNDFALKTALENPQSVFNAVINIASIGLSLNPATKLAYLVPRDKAIHLDISYQGLIQLATDTGSVMWAKAQLVYANDRFQYKGPAVMPDFSADVFGDRGDFRGVYCIAKTHDGDYLVETMSAAEVEQIKNESATIKWAKNDNDRARSPWNTYPGEMTKKACIKRAYKTWPKTQQHERMATAIEVLNEADGSDWQPYTLEEREQFDEWIETKNGAAMIKLMEDDLDKYSAIHRSVFQEIPRGGKGKKKEELKQITEKAHATIFDCADAIIEALTNNESGIIADVLADLDEVETELVRRKLSALQIEQLEQILEDQS